MDPLSLLKEYITHHRQIKQEDGDFVFGSIRFPKNTPTNFLKQQKDPYPLDVVYFAYQHAETLHRDYLMACSKSKHAIVTLNEKKQLVDYLTGKIDSSPFIVQRIHEADEGERKAKRQKTENLEDIEMDEKLLEEKKQVAQHLESLQPTTSEVSGSKKIDGMSQEQISHLQSLRAKVKMATISVGDEETPKKPQAKGRFLEADAQVTKRITERERLLSTRSSILNVTGKRSFADIIASVNKKESEKRKSLPSDKPEGEKFNFKADAKIETDAEKTPGSKHVTPPQGAPIIIVPSAATALLTMYNAKDFIDSGTYVPSLDKKALNPKKEAVEHVKKLCPKLKDLPIGFQIVDNTAKFTSKDWNRVAAVFVIGQPWQFKDWQWSTPVELLSNVKGFYLRYDDQNVPPEVKSWNVKILTISKTKRYLDSTAALEFWNTLEDFMSRKKV